MKTLSSDTASNHPNRLNTEPIRELAERAIKQGVFPGIEILCARGETLLFHEAYGKMDRGQDSPPMDRGSIFDLASLTKPLATATAVLHLSDGGQLRLDGYASDIITEFKNSEKEGITLSQLLTHSAGFSDWLPLYEPRFDRETAWKKLVAAPLAYQPGTSVIYSCLGYIVLGEIVRRTAGCSLADYCSSRIFTPLGLKTLGFNPDPGQEKMVTTAFCPLRKKWLNGVVHDENAFAFGGEGGNAGLFGTAADIHRVCLMLLSSGRINGERLFSDQAVQAMLINQNPTTLPARTFGWDVNDGRETEMSCGNRMPTGSIGHLGFTGTSIWMDPVSEIMIILLSNRVNLSREDNIPLMRVFRPKMHTTLLSTVF